MLKKLYRFLDFFLPHQISDFVEIAVHYQARLVVAANLAALIVCCALFTGAVYLEMSVFTKIGILSSCIVLSALIIFFKTRLVNFERSLVIGSTLQIFVLSGLVYLISFSPNGMGHFGLIWLLPIFLMNAFYFKPTYSLALVAFNFLILIFVSNFYANSFLRPIDSVMHFQKVFFLFLFLVVVLCFVLSFIFLQLGQHLQKEILNQKENVIEKAKYLSLGQMTSNLAHDINNPLFTIQGKLHQMRNLLNRDELDLASCDRIIETVEATILRLSQIVKGISQFARQSAGDQMVSVRVQDLIENNLTIAEDRLKKRGIKLKLDINQNANVICYPAFISQALTNLFHNSLESLESEENKFIEVEAYTAHDWVEIHIRDSGPGIPNEIENKIFEPYFTTKKFGKGTGLGLSVSKGLIEAHDGELLVAKEKGLTTFIVRLPSYE